ncbi:MAG: electron transport complex subunit E [Tissierellia bacterium]|nr:electron transport complex subunit E [Tissierellia bacterium]
MKLGKIFKEGLFSNNPVLIQMVGLCSVLAISSSVLNSLGMGLSVTFVLVCSNIVISLLRNFIPNEIRIPAFIVVIASFVTIVQMVLEAFVPALYDSLGIFIPLIVVNCIILARAEAFSSKNKVIPSIIDALGNGLGYTLAITILGVVRELLGNGTILDQRIISEDYVIGFMQQPASSFILLGVMMAVVAYSQNKKSQKAIASDKEE